MNSQRSIRIIHWIYLYRYVIDIVLYYIVFRVLIVTTLFSFVSRIGWYSRHRSSQKRIIWIFIKTRRKLTELDIPRKVSLFFILLHQFSHSVSIIFISYSGHVEIYLFCIDPIRLIIEIVKFFIRSFYYIIIAITIFFRGHNHSISPRWYRSSINVWNIHIEWIIPNLLGSWKLRYS